MLNWKEKTGIENTKRRRLRPYLMREGILEVVIVSAKSIGHTNIIGTPAYYVNIECGNQVRRSKVSMETTNDDNCKEVLWNEKFTFEFSYSELKNLSVLKFKVMDEELFTDGFVGETIVHLKGLIAEGNDKGEFEIRPTPYNVVLEDDTYKGEIKIGLKFFSNPKEACSDARALVKEEEDLGESICKTVTKACKTPWLRFMSLFENTNSEDKPKQF